MEGKPGMLFPSYLRIEKWIRSLLSPSAIGAFTSSSKRPVKASEMWTALFPSISLQFNPGKCPRIVRLYSCRNLLQMSQSTVCAYSGVFGNGLP